MLRYRPVEDADICLICQFPQTETELYFMHPKASYPLTYEQLKEAIDERRDSTVLLSDNRVSGFANFYVCEPGQKCTIGNVVVAPEHRGHGLGKHLIETMIRIAFEKHKVKEVQIACFNQNVAGLLLYSKLGFRPFSIEERYENQGSRVALIHMKLTRTM